MRTAEWKLIVHHDRTSGDEREELYHLTTDPGERTNLLGEEPAVAAALRGKLNEQRSGGRATYWQLEADDDDDA